MNFNELISCDLMEKVDGQSYPKIIAFLFESHMNCCAALFRLVVEGVLPMNIYDEFNTLSSKGLDSVRDSIKEYLKNKEE